MQIDPLSHGLWELTAPPAPATGPLVKDLVADAVVIGAGFTGLSAGLHLAEGGARVVVLEAAEPGFGGSGRNVGLVNAGLWLMPEAVRAALPQPYGERLLTLLGEAPGIVFELIERLGIDCDAVRTGTLHCAVGPRGLAEIKSRAAQWLARGAAVRLLDAEEAARAIGSTAYAGALLDHRAGTIQPLAYVRGLARAAMAAGAQLFTQSRVTTAVRANDRWLVRTAGGSVVAPFVVVATNAYTDGALPWAGIRDELVALPYFQFATAPLDHNLASTILPDQHGAWDSRTILSSFRKDAAGRLIFGSVGTLRGAGLGLHRAWAQRALARIFPEAADLAFASAWHGRIGMTADAMPRFHVWAPKVVSFSGYNGRGIAPGTVFGRALAQLVLERTRVEELPLPVAPPAPERLRGLKSAWYAVGAALAHFAAARGGLGAVSGRTDKG